MKTLIRVICLWFMVAVLTAGMVHAAKTPQSMVRDELILAIGGEPEGGFDPTTGWGRYGSPLFQSTLLKRNRNMEIAHDLATGYQVSDDGLTWTVTLREDVLFSDGVPLSAKDVAYTFKTAKKSSSVVDLSALESIDALSDHTVRFKLARPQSTFINILVNTGIVPKHAHGPDYSQHPLGSGPYEFVQWDKGQQLIVRANPRYYGKKPFFKKMTFLYLSEEGAYAAAKAGQVDVASIVPMFAGHPVANMRLVPLESVDNRGIMFPCVSEGKALKEGRLVGNPVTADEAIRKAVNVAVDRKALVDGVLYGYGSPAYSACDHLPWWNPDTVMADGDMEAAKAILAKAGWKDRDGDRILEKNGLKARFTLYYPSTDQTRQSLAIAVADRMKRLGIVIDVEGKSWDEIRTKMHANAVLFGWGSHNPMEMYNLYYSKFKGRDYFNAGYYTNPTVDAYMKQAMESVDQKKAQNFWKKAQWDGKTGCCAKGDAPWAWLVNLNHLYLVRNDLSIGQQKIHPHGHGWPLTDNIEEWAWLAEKEN